MWANDYCTGHILPGTGGKCGLSGLQNCRVLLPCVLSFGEHRPSERRTPSAGPHPREAGTLQTRKPNVQTSTQVPVIWDPAGRADPAHLAF